MKNAFKLNIQVQFKHIDLLGHVNNVEFFTYFEMARVAFIRENMPGRIGRESFPFILAHASCDYLKPILLGSDLVVHLCTDNIGTKSYQYVYLLTDASDESIVYAKGESVQVFYDYSKNTSIEIPPDFRAFLLRFKRGA